jgi:hypothetical protein
MAGAPSVSVPHSSRSKRLTRFPIAAAMAIGPMRSRFFETMMPTPVTISITPAHASTRTSV